MSVEVCNYAASISKAHTQYWIEKNGKKIRVPGVTTITGVMDKPALVPWANKIGLQGIEVGKYVDELASVGSLCHWMISKHVGGAVIIDVELQKFHSLERIRLAKIGYEKFLQWEDDVGFEAIFSENAFVSNKFEFGGTIDLYGVMKKRNDRKILGDIKTCKAVYSEHFTQVGGGYGILMDENKLPYDDVRIIRVGRSEDEGFEDKPLINVTIHQKRFICCRNLYDLNRQIEKGR